VDPVASDTETCPGCGAIVPVVPELRSDHLYVGAAAGCFVAYTELLGRELSDPRLTGAHMLFVDVYTAQHPGVPGRQSSQSVWVHLVGLCLVLEHGLDAVMSARAKARLASPDAVFDWLVPPSSLGPTTVLDVLATAGAEEHAGTVRSWAERVWEAWAPHHDAIRRRTIELLGSLR
jgi:hypothetical protein